METILAFLSNIENLEINFIIFCRFIVINFSIFISPFYRKFCEESFGAGIWPDTDRKNTEYGALNLQAFNLLMSNGDEGIFIFMKILGNGQV